MQTEIGDILRASPSSPSFLEKNVRVSDGGHGHAVRRKSLPSSDANWLSFQALKTPFPWGKLDEILDKFSNGKARAHA